MNQSWGAVSGGLYLLIDFPQQYVKFLLGTYITLYFVKSKHPGKKTVILYAAINMCSSH